MDKDLPIKTIYYVTSGILDAYKVSTIHIDEICTNFAKLKHKVVLYAPLPGSFKQPDSYQIKYCSSSRFRLIFFFQIRLFLQLLVDTFRNKPWIIYVRYNELLFVPVLIGKIVGIPVVLEINGLPIEELRRIDRTLLTRILLALGVIDFIEFINVKLASGMIVVTPGIKKYFVEKYILDQQKISVIANGVNTKLMSPLSAAESRSKLGLDESVLYVGYVGSLLPWQGLRFMAEAALRVCAEHPDVNFLIVGDGEEADYLSSFIKKNGLEKRIEMRSSVSHDLVPYYINAMDICISYPDKFRNGVTSPFKIFEYLACAKPVVSSDIAGIREYFGNVLCYAEPESSESLASVLLSLIENKAVRDYLGLNGRKFVVEGHSWELVTKQILDYCQKIIK